MDKVGSKTRRNLAPSKHTSPGMMVDINITDFLGNDSDPNNIEVQEPHPPNHQEKVTHTQHNHYNDQRSILQLFLCTI